MRRTGCAAPITAGNTTSPDSASKFLRSPSRAGSARRSSSSPIPAWSWVPIDDENCMTWCFTHHPTRALSEHEVEVMRGGGGIHVKLIPGSFRPLVNKDNDYMIDRAAQRAGNTYCGVAGIAMQDAAIQESMGPVQDRSKENL